MKWIAIILIGVLAITLPACSKKTESSQTAVTQESPATASATAAPETMAAATATPMPPGSQNLTVVLHPPAGTSSTGVVTLSQTTGVKSVSVQLDLSKGALAGVEVMGALVDGNCPKPGTNAETYYGPFTNTWSGTYQFTLDHYTDHAHAIVIRKMSDPNTVVSCGEIKK